MLGWQPKLYKLVSLPVKIGATCALAHLVVLFFLLFIYNTHSKYQIIITGKPLASNVPIIFMPMHKSIKGSNRLNSASAVNQSSNVKVAAAETKTSTVFAAPAKALVKTSQKSDKRSKKTVTEKKRKEKEQLASAKVLPKPASKKEVEKKEKVEVKPPAVEQKIETTAQPASQVASENPVVATHDAIDQSLPPSDAVYVGQEEWDLLQRQHYIENEMAQHWSPPHGMRSDLVCSIKLVIDHEGIVKTITVENSSGVLLFDGAAERAAAQMTPPRWAYGKEISLLFKP